MQGKDTATSESQTKFHRRTQENTTCSRGKISKLRCVTVLDQEITMTHNMYYMGIILFDPLSLERAP